MDIQLCALTLLIPKCPSKPRTGTIVASRESRWGTVVPVAIKRYVPREIAEQFQIVGSIRLKSEPTQFGEHGEGEGGD
jgi:hypothetical protein